MDNLSRPLPDGDTATTLYATRFEVEWYNAVNIDQQPGNPTIYRAEDMGDVKKLKSVTAPKTLTLKLNCPVVLLKNIGQGLVNGSQGVVTILETDGPTVKFDKGEIKLTKKLFTVFSGSHLTPQAQRLQYPISAAFALTMHKSQGLTLPRVVVDCKNIFAPGQLGVAVGRAVNLDGLQVLNYSPACCKSHPPQVDAFYSEAGTDCLEDLSCCRKILVASTHDVPVHCPADDEDSFLHSEDSDYGEDELKVIETWELASLQVQPEDIVGEGNEGTSDGAPQADDKTACPIEIPCRYDKVEIVHIMNSFRTAAITTEQREVNSSLDYLLDDHTNLITFFNLSYHNLSIIPEKTDVKKKETSFLQAFHRYLNQEDYQLSCKELFQERQVHRQVAGDIITYIRKAVKKDVLDKDLPSASSSRPQIIRKKDVEILNSGYGKIRFVGGFAVAKVKHHHMNRVRSAFQSQALVLDVSSKVKVDLLQAMTVSQTIISQTTNFPESLIEITRKQNLSLSLTHITDPAFEFFLCLETKRLGMYSEENLKNFKEDILQIIHDEMTNDTELAEGFFRLFSGHLHLSSFPPQKDNPLSEEDDVMFDVLQGCQVFLDLYEDIVHKYLDVSDSEFRRKVLQKKGKQKSMELRKKIFTKKSESSSGVKKVQKKSMLVKENVSEEIIEEPMLVEPEEESVGVVEHEGETDIGKGKGKGRGKGKGKGRGRGRGRGPGRKQATKRVHDDSDDDTSCDVCNVGYPNPEGEPWINCSRCDKWFHRSCVNLSDEEKWAEASAEGADWYCPFCC